MANPKPRDGKMYSEPLVDGIVSASSKGHIIRYREWTERGEELESLMQYTKGRDSRKPYCQTGLELAVAPPTSVSQVLGL